MPAQHLICAFVWKGVVRAGMRGFALCAGTIGHPFPVEGAFKIIRLQVQALANRNWRVEVRTEGTLAGDYTLQVVQVRGSKVLQNATPYARTSTVDWVVLPAE